MEENAAGSTESRGGSAKFFNRKIFVDDSHLWHQIKEELNVGPRNVGGDGVDGKFDRI